jgi:hypothetical protein
MGTMSSDRGSAGSNHFCINTCVRLPEQEMPLLLHCTSREAGYKITVSDLLHVVGKHYAVAVDIFDTHTDVVLNALLATMNRNDSVTLITFGDHIESTHFNMTQDVADIVYKMLDRRECGCNVAGALYELDQTECDHRVLISNGGYDDGPEEVTLANEVMLISPGTPAYPVITYPVVNDTVQLVLRTDNGVCIRKQIRQLLKKPRPNYYQISFQAGQRHFVRPLSFGGCTTMYIGDFEGNIQLNYSDSAGNKFIEEIEII